MEMVSGFSLEARPPVTVMAELVQLLVDGGRARLEDGRWLQARAEAAGLGPHERGALEALRLHLHDDVALLGDSPGLSWV